MGRLPRVIRWGGEATPPVACGGQKYRRYIRTLNRPAVSKNIILKQSHIVREEEEKQELPGSKEDKELYMLFETNHPDLELPGDEGEDGDEMSELEKANMVARVIRKYKHRWGIENGFKQIKSFRVRTTSMSYEYRFFNFLYACTLYNVWRLTDLLVKLELRAESEFRYEPLVTAELFLTIAKDYVGLDPPD